MPSQMFPMMCNVDGCDARLIETIHPGVFVCLAPHSKTPVFEYKSEDEILYGTPSKVTTGTVLAVPSER